MNNKCKELEVLLYIFIYILDCNWENTNRNTYRFNIVWNIWFINYNRKGRELVGKAHHLDELNEYNENYNKFRKWLEDFNKNINNPDLQEIKTKEDFDKFISDLDEAVDSIKDFKSL